MDEETDYESLAPKPRVAKTTYSRKHYQRPPPPPTTTTTTSAPRPPVIPPSRQSASNNHAGGKRVDRNKTSNPRAVRERSLPAKLGKRGYDDDTDSTAKDDAESADDEPQLKSRQTHPASKRVRRSQSPSSLNASSGTPARPNPQLSTTVIDRPQQPFTLVLPVQSTARSKPKPKRRLSTSDANSTIRQLEHTKRTGRVLPTSLRTIATSAKPTSNSSSSRAVASDLAARDSENDPGPARKRAKSFQSPAASTDGVLHQPSPRTEVPTRSDVQSPPPSSRQAASVQTTLPSARGRAFPAGRFSPRPQSQPTRPQPPRILSDKSNLPRKPRDPPNSVLATSRAQSAVSPRTSAAIVADPQRRHASTGSNLLSVNAASDRGRRSSSALTSRTRIRVHHDTEDDENQVQDADALLDLAPLSSALPSATDLDRVDAIPPRSRSPNHLLVSHATSSHLHDQYERLQHGPLPQPTSIRSPLSITAFDIDDEEEIAQVYRPPRPREGSAIPEIEGNSSIILETFDDSDDLMETEGKAGRGAQGDGVGVEQSGRLEQFANLDDLIDPFLSMTPEFSQIHLEERLDKALPTLVEPTISPADGGAPQSTTTVSEERAGPSAKRGAPSSSPAKPEPFATSRDLPPRLVLPPPDSPSSNGPASSEDDLAYVIRTTSTGEGQPSSDDDEVLADAEATVGRGLRPGARLGIGPRRGLAGRLSKQVLDEAPRYRESDSDDELLLGARRAPSRLPAGSSRRRS